MYDSTEVAGSTSSGSIGSSALYRQRAQDRYPTPRSSTTRCPMPDRIEACTEKSSRQEAAAQPRKRRTPSDRPVWPSGRPPRTGAPSFARLAFSVLATLALVVSLTLVVAKDAVAYDPLTDELRLLDYTNRQRQQAGLPPLKIWPRAAEVARQHSKEMAETRTLSHSPDWNLVDPIWTAAGQNVGMVAGPFGDPAVQTIQCGSPTACNPLPSPIPPCPWSSPPPGSEGRAFLTSKPHCENVMNPSFNFVGIGIVYASDGSMWVTVDFFAVPNPPPNLAFPPPPPPSESPLVPLPSIRNEGVVRYFAEGYTGTGFDTLYEIFNYSSVDADVTLTFYLNDRSVERTTRIPPKSSVTIDVSEYVGRGKDVGAKIASNVPVAVERQMRFDYRLSGVEGSSLSSGMSSPRRVFLLPEGYTGPGFEQWLTLLNPQSMSAQVRLTFMKPDGSTIERWVTVPAKTRQTVEVRPIVGYTEVSTKVESVNGVPILVERPMYFQYRSIFGLGTMEGGHVGAGIDSPGTHFYLAEGYTGAGFEEWVTIQNPDPSRAANVRLRYLLDTGGFVERSFRIGPHSRFTRMANSDVPGHSVSVELFSDLPVAVERPMYFDYRSWRDGHNGQGLASAARYWAVAGVDTRLFVDTWITIGNPNAEPATVTLYFFSDGSPPFVRNFTVPANGRGSYKANDIAPQGKRMGLIVASTKPVAVEKPTYQWTPGAVGGDVSPGVALG